VNQLKEVDRQIEAIERELVQIQRAHPIARLLASIPGVGPITATALAATVPDPTMFRSGREFAAWLGLTPRQNSTGGKDRLGRITKQGDSYLRHLLVIGHVMSSGTQKHGHGSEAAGSKLYSSDVGPWWLQSPLQTS
jgi:transposase